MEPSQQQLEQWAQAGVAALRRGDAAAARAAFTPITATGRASIQVWLLLAQSCDMLDDRDAARAAINQVLAQDPANPYPLVMGGEIALRDGDDRAAVDWIDRALAAADHHREAGTNLPADLLERLARAEAARSAALGRFEASITNALAAKGVDAHAAGPRLAEALGILSGRQQPYLQQPTSFYFPRLPQVPFYDPADFDFVPGLVAALPAIRAEALAALAGGEGVAPYVANAPGRAIRSHALLDDPRWSAFHFWTNGVPVGDHAARCPATVAALQAAPLPQIKGYAPMGLFSILKPHTHIPPHHGLLNTRLICHLPLVVPAGCRLRVGAETREVRTGEVLIFDDSIEHEAWNDSDEVRVILLFEIWRPELTATERAALTVMFETVAGYQADQG
ncbi:MAG: aspartyl/asparaginyl beta-hydroxylase domain-containing protein [Sphingomonadales bacterium]